MFSAGATATASGVNDYGVLVTSSGSATATSDISEADAFRIATLLAQNIANSQLQNDINIIDQSVDIAIDVVGVTGATGPTGNEGPIGQQGKTGVTGPTAEQGRDGATGPTGQKGDNGRAANTGAT